MSADKFRGTRGPADSSGPLFRFPTWLLHPYEPGPHDWNLDRRTSHARAGALVNAHARERAFPEFRDTPLWAAAASVFAELEATGEVRIDTGPDYVIGYLCRELAAKGVVDARALTPRR